MVMRGRQTAGRTNLRSKVRKSFESWMSSTSVKYPKASRSCLLVHAVMMVSFRNYRSPKPSAYNRNKRGERLTSVNGQNPGTSLTASRNSFKYSCWIFNSACLTLTCILCAAIPTAKSAFPHRNPTAEVMLTLLELLDAVIVVVALEETGDLGDELGNVFGEDGVGHCGCWMNGERKWEEEERGREGRWISGGEVVLLQGFWRHVT